MPAVLSAAYIYTKHVLKECLCEIKTFHRKPIVRILDLGISINSLQSIAIYKLGKIISTVKSNITLYAFKAGGGGGGSNAEPPGI